MPFFLYIQIHNMHRIRGLHFDMAFMYQVLKYIHRADSATLRIVFVSCTRRDTHTHSLSHHKHTVLLQCEGIKSSKRTESNKWKWRKSRKRKEEEKSAVRRRRHNRHGRKHTLCFPRIVITIDHRSRHRKINARQSNDIEVWWTGRIVVRPDHTVIVYCSEYV